MARLRRKEELEREPRISCFARRVGKLNAPVGPIQDDRGPTFFPGAQWESFLPSDQFSLFLLLTLGLAEPASWSLPVETFEKKCFVFELTSLLKQNVYFPESVLF